jgi:drug/metabolite transporter (DMT)-like permease|tara:strand:+ start:219 stop:1061 length:843 start_codon:yes stop_codon:yes gene_type:complete
MFVFHQGVLWMLIATFFFALMGTFVKLGGENFTPTELVFYRSSISLVFIIGIMSWKNISYSSNYIKLHLSRSVIGFISLLFFFYAINHLPLSTAISLNYTSPLFLGLLMPLILRRKVKKWLFLAVTIGFLGVFFILKPTFENHNYFAGLIGLISGLGAAIAYLFVTQLGQLKEPVLRTIFYFTLVSTMCSGIMMLFGEVSTIQFKYILILLALGSTATIAQIAITKAYLVGNTLGNAGLSYLTIIFATIIGVVWFGEFMDWKTTLGIVLIIISGIFASKK